MAKINPIIIVGGVAAAGIAGYALYQNSQKKEEKTSGGSSGGSSIDLSFLSDLFSGIGTNNLSDISGQIVKFVQDGNSKIIEMIPTADDVKKAADDAVKNLLPNGNPLDGLKETFGNLGTNLQNAAGNIIPKKIDFNFNWGSDKGSSQGGFLGSGLDLGKAGILAVGGWEAAGLLSGLSAPFLPFMAAAGATIAGANALRQNTIASTGYTPEQNIMNAVSSIIPGSSRRSGSSGSAAAAVGQSQAYSGINFLKLPSFGSGSFGGHGASGSW